jgi:hypothetical protein
VVWSPVLLHNCFFGEGGGYNATGASLNSSPKKAFARKSAQKQTLTKPPDDGGGQHALLKISAPTTYHALQVGCPLGPLHGEDELLPTSCRSKRQIGSHAQEVSRRFEVHRSSSG